MKSIHIANSNQRDALVVYGNTPYKSKIHFTLADGSSKRNVRILKCPESVELTTIAEKAGGMNALSQALLDGDPELDLERSGMLIDEVKRVFVNSSRKIVYHIRQEEEIHLVDGSIKESRPLKDTFANVNAEQAISWTGKLIPREQAIRMFVFSRSYQIKHVNGLTFDFLFEMAKTLHESKSLMLVGTGKKGIDPLVFQNSGTPYRGFLEGRIKGSSYRLVLHLSNMELKDLSGDES